MLSYEVWICLFRYVRSYFKSYVRLDRHSFDKFYTFFSNFNQHDNFYNLLMSSLGENNVTWLGRYLSFRLRIVSYTVAVTVTCVLVLKDKYDMRQKQRLWYSCCQLLTHFPFRFASHLHNIRSVGFCRGSRVKFQGTRVICRGSRVERRGFKNVVDLFVIIL